PHVGGRRGLVRVTCPDADEHLDRVVAQGVLAGSLHHVLELEVLQVCLNFCRNGRGVAHDLPFEVFSPSIVTPLGVDEARATTPLRGGLGTRLRRTLRSVYQRHEGIPRAANCVTLPAFHSQPERGPPCSGSKPPRPPTGIGNCAPPATRAISSTRTRCIPMARTSVRSAATTSDRRPRSTPGGLGLRTHHAPS